MTLTTWAFVRLLLRVIVTVPLPAVIVPLTLVVLHAGPVQTEIASALTVSVDARLAIPKKASASSDFFKFVNENISLLLDCQASLWDERNAKQINL
jgi:hypothetical protein